MKSIFVIIFVLSSSFYVNSQDKKDLAKVYFQKALKSYEVLDLDKTTKYLEKSKELNGGITSEKVAVFGSKFFYELGVHEKAEEYFKAYFKINKSKTSDTYKKMLVAYTDNLDAKENPNAVNKLKVLKKEKEKQVALENANNIKNKKEEIVRLNKSIKSLENSLSYISNKNTSQYIAMLSSLNKMKERLNLLQK